MSALIRGAKGGAGSQHTPVETADSLHSVQRARIIDALSEGPIKGFAHGGTNPLLDVYLSETPVANADGSLNFANVEVDSRKGTQDQEAMAQFSNVENEIGVGVELRYGTPWTQAVVDLDLTALRLHLAVEQLQQSDTSTGDIKGYAVQYKIELSTDGGAFEELETSTIKGKTTTEYVKTHWIELPPANDTGWVLRVTRLTTNADSATTADTTTIKSYTEIVDAKLRYPNTALVGIVIDAKQFSSIPSRAYDIYGRVISVPSNYNPTTRAYTGTWDGSFKPAWTDNPAWIFYDLVTHPRYGLGQWISAAKVDKWGLYQIAQYCDELVPDGKGGEEPRFTCNHYIQSQADAYKVLSDLTSIFRGMAFWAGGTIQSSADMPGDPEFVYTNANVVDGRFTYQGSDRKTRFTVALVSWNDPSDFYRAKVAYVPDREGIARYGVRETRIIATGATSEGQAQRAGLHALLTSRLETEVVTFEVGQDGYLVAPGKLARIADAKRAKNRQGGRIHSATTTVITVDKEPGIIEIGGSLTVMLPSGVSETRTISAIDGRDLTVSAAFSELPLPEAAWVAEASTLAAQTVRILSVAQAPSSGEDSLKFTVTALQHNASKFDAIDYGAMIVTPPTVPIDGGYLPPPTVVSVTSYARKGQTRAIPVLEIGWPRVTGATKYLVQYRRENGEWSTVHEVTGNRLEVRDVLPGDYVAQVAAANKLAESLAAVSDPYTLDDSALTPTILDDLQSQVSDAQADATAALADIAEFSQDGVLNPLEKKRLITDYNVLTTEQPGIDAEAVAFGVTTQKTNYDSALSALTAYLATLTSPTAWNDITGDTTITRATFRSKWQDVYTLRQACLNAIYAAARQKAQDAQDEADQAHASAVVQNSNFTKNLNGWTFEATAGPVGSTEFQRGTTAANSPYTPIPTHLIHNGQAGQTSAYAVNDSYIAVQAGQIVTASVALRSLSANSGARAQVFVRFYDKDGSYIGFIAGSPLLDPTAAPQLNSTVKAPAPASAAFGRVCILYTGHTSGVITATCAMLTATISNQDDVPDSAAYRRTPQMGSSVSVENSQFELSRDANGNIPGWSPFSSSTLSLVSSTQNGGTVALNITGGTNAGAETNKKYACSTNEYIYATCDIITFGSATGRLMIRFYQSDGTVISGNPTGLSSSSSWTTVTVGQAAPAGAAYFTLLIYISNTGGGTIYADGVRLYINDVRVAGSGVKVGDQRNLPTVNFGNYGSAWQGLSFSYTATTTTATLTASAATLWVGGKPVTYNSASVSVTGTAGTTKTFYLYYDDPGPSGGSQTLRSTTNRVTAQADDSRLALGTATVTFPSSGTSSGSGGNGPCPDENAWVLRADPEGKRADWPVRAREIEVGHHLRLTDGRAGLVTYSQRKPADRVLVVADGRALTCSTSAPLELSDTAGDCVLAPDAAGQVIKARFNGAHTGAFVERVDDAGPGYVQHITCENACFWTGDDPDYLFGHHNLKPGDTG